jgi:hypothetical protein
MVATIGTFCYALPDIPMALHAAAPWVAAGALACGMGSAVSNTFSGTALQQQVPPEMLARVSSLTLFPAYGIGVIGYAIDGPLSAALGTSVVFGVGAVYGLLSSAVVLTLPSVRAVRWRDQVPPAQWRDRVPPAQRRDQVPPAQRRDQVPPAQQRAAGLVPLGGGPEGGEGGQPRDHGDDHRDRKHLRHVGRRREGDDADG